jgi:hypothetical protein
MGADLFRDACGRIGHRDEKDAARPRPRHVRNARGAEEDAHGIEGGQSLETWAEALGFAREREESKRDER